MKGGFGLRMLNRTARVSVFLPRRRPVIQRLPSSHADPSFSDGSLFLDRLVHWLSETLRVDIVSLMVPDDRGEHLEILAALGLPESVIQSTRVRRGASIVGKVWGTAFLMAGRHMRNCMAMRRRHFAPLSGRMIIR